MSKLEQLDGAKYCLVLHNQQFLSLEEWTKAKIPSLSKFDAVIVLHHTKPSHSHKSGKFYSKLESRSR